MRPAAVGLTLGALAVFFQGACRSHPESALLRVEYGGCSKVLAGPVCTLKANGQILAWVTGTATPTFSGARVVGEPVAVQEGRRYRLEVEPQARRIEVDADGRTWTLEIGPRNPPSWSAEVDRLLKARQLDDAGRVLEQAVATGPKDEQGRALSALARVAMQRGRQEQAGDLLRRAIRDHKAQGRVLDEVNDAAMLLFTLLNDSRRLEEARTILLALPAGPSAPAEAAYQAAYFNGLLARTTGDLRTALRQLDQAARQAERLGLEPLQRAAELNRAETLQALGRREDAEELLERLLQDAPKDLAACQRAQLLLTIGWNRLLVREVGEDGPDPVPVLEEALLSLGAGCPELPSGALDLRLNLALAHVQTGKVKAARAQLEAAGAPMPRSLQHVFWQKDIEARLELAEGRPARALQRYDELRGLADATLDWGAQWRAAAGRAEALRALRRDQDALASYAQAEALLDADSLQVPIQDGREAFIAGREGATRRHLDLLLRAGRTTEALTLARHSHARILSALALGERLSGLPPDKRRSWDESLAAYHRKRDELAAKSAMDWKLSADRLRRLRDERAATRIALAELLDGSLALLGRDRARPVLRAPRDGETILAFHPLPVGEVGFAADPSGVVAVRLDCLARKLPEASLSACLLGPFADRIRAARQVTLLPFGEFGALDFHALPFDGAPLLAGRPVAWSVDLPESEAPPRDAALALALIVGDPRGDLPAARREVRSVEAALRSANRGWRFERREGESARDTEIRSLLPRADLFHFAGHAEFTGRSGWDSVLPLADSGLTVADILALERAPRWAILSGCETGRTSGKTGEGLGLAQAFLTRGSVAVLATTRRVSDETTAALVEAFYRSWSAGVTPVTALQRAQIVLSSANSHTDWAAFRFIER